MCRRLKTESWLWPWGGRGGLIWTQFPTCIVQKDLIQTESRCFTARSAQQAGYRTDCPLVVFSCSACDLNRICPQEFRGENIKFSLIWVYWSCKWRSCIKFGWSTSVSSSFRFQPTRISSPLVHVLLPCNHVVLLYLLQTAGSCSFVSLLLLKYVFCFCCDDLPRLMLFGKCLQAGVDVSHTNHLVTDVLGFFRGGLCFEKPENST